MKRCALGSQFITIAKAPCQAFTAAALNFFFDGKTRASFFMPTRMRSLGKFRRTSTRRDLLRSALHQSSE